MLYKKYNEGGSTSGPKMTQSLATTLMEIQANTDINKIKKKQKKLQDALMDEQVLGEEAGAKEDLYSTYGRNIGGWGAALATKKWGGDKYSKYAPIAGSLFDIIGGKIGAQIAGDYEEKTIEELAEEHGIDLSSTKFHGNRAKELLETGTSGLSSIDKEALKGRRDLRKENLLRGVLAAPTYGEVAGGEDWLTNLFGLGTDTEEEYPYTEVPMGTRIS